MGKDEQGRVRYATRLVRPTTHIGTGRLGSRTPSAKKTKLAANRLNYLRNDLDLWHHKVSKLLDDQKHIPTKEEIKNLGVEIIQHLHTRKLLTTAEIRNASLPEPDLTPRRPCSGSPSRTPQSNVSHGTFKNQEFDRDSTATHYQLRDDPIRKNLNFDEDKDKEIITLKNKLKSLQVGYGLLQHERDTLQKDLENRSEVTSQMIKLEEENNGLVGKLRNLEDNNKFLCFKITLLESQRSEADANQRLNRGKYERNQLAKHKERSCPDCATIKTRMERYKAERNEARYEWHEAKQKNEVLVKAGEDAQREKDILIKTLKGYKDQECEIERFVHKIDLLNDLDILKKRISTLEGNIAHYKEENTALKNTIENQKKMIVEIEIRKELLEKTNAELRSTDVELKDARLALTITKDTYKKEKERASAQIRNLDKENNELKTQLTEIVERCREQIRKTETDINDIRNQKEETLKLLQKHKSESSITINNLKKELQEEKAKSCKLQARVEKSEESYSSRKQRETEDIRWQNRQNQELRDENKSHKSKIGDLEIILAKEQNEQIDIEKKYYMKIAKLEEVQKADSAMINELRREITFANANLKEQQAHFAFERTTLEKKIRDLDIELANADETKCIESCKHHQEQLDQKNEELSNLTRQRYSLKEELDAVKRQNHLIIEEKEELRRKFDDVYAQLQENDLRNALSSSKRLSDIEKENASLKQKILVTSRSLTELREICKEQKEKMDIDKFHYENESKHHNKDTEENCRLKEQVKHLQVELKHFQAKVDALVTEKLDIEGRMRSLTSDLKDQEVLRAQNKSLTTTLEKLTADLRVLEQRYRSVDEGSDQTKKENERLRKEMSLAKKEVDRLTREKEDLSEQLQIEIDSSKSELQKLMIEKTELTELFKNESDQAKEKINKLKSDKDDLLKRYKSEAAVRKTTDKDYVQIKDENDRLRKERSLARNDVHKLTKENEELLEQFQAELYKLKKEKTELTELFKDESNRAQEKIKKLESEKDDLQNRIPSAEKSNQQIAYDLLQLKNDLSIIQKQKALIEEELVDVKQDNFELEGQLRHHKQIAQELDKLKRDLESCVLHKNNAEQKLTELQRENSELNNQIALQLQQKEKKESTVAEIERKYQDQLKRYQRAERQIEQLQADIGSGKKDKTEIKKKLESLRGENTRLEEQLSSQKYTRSEEGKELTALKVKISRLQAENEDLNNSCKQKDGHLQKMDDEIVKLQMEINDLQTTVIGQKKEKETLNNHYKTLLKEKQEAEIKMRDCENCKMLQTHVNTLKEDSKAVRRELEQKVSLLEKANKEICQVKAGKSRLETALIVEKQEKETLASKLEHLRSEKLDLENRLKQKPPQVVSEQKSCPNCWKYRNEISDLKREVNDLRDRLSEAAGNKLRENNPNIADLSDMNRPTSLAEKFSSLYTDEYTDAMEVIEDNLDEAGCVRVMLKWLKNCSELCETIAKEQRDEFRNNSIGFMRKYSQQVDVVLSDRCLIYVKEFQKKIAAESLEVVGKICHMKSVTEENLFHNNFIIKYIKKCTELCWMMQISDPPLYLNFDVKKGENLDKNVYNVFTHSGSKIDYLVWPALYLHTTGPMLAKGVAQGM